MAINKNVPNNTYNPDIPNYIGFSPYFFIIITLPHALEYVLNLLQI